MAVPRDQPLEAHLEALRPLVVLEVHCETCGRAFVEPRALEQHARSCNAKRAAPDAGPTISRADELAKSLGRYMSREIAESAS
eukprot:13051210-Heterocapsa_arctica.AAC.1